MAEAGNDTGTRPVFEVTAKELPVYCPNPKLPLWSWHPRVYLTLNEQGETSCPYCGTRYRLVGGAPQGH